MTAEPTPSYWIVTWPGKDQGVHVAYKDLEEANRAAKNIANYSTRKTETTIIPLYSEEIEGRAANYPCPDCYRPGDCDGSCTHPAEGN